MLYNFHMGYLKENLIQGSEVSLDLDHISRLILAKYHYGLWEIDLQHHTLVE